MSLKCISGYVQARLGITQHACPASSTRLPTPLILEPNRIRRFRVVLLDLLLLARRILLSGCGVHATLCSSTAMPDQPSSLSHVYREDAIWEYLLPPLLALLTLNVRLVIALGRLVQDVVASGPHVFSLMKGRGKRY